MSRKWKPGDVAMVTARWIRTDAHSARYAVRKQGCWRSRAGVEVLDHEVSGARPLVVIDPEDAEQVERLLTLVDEWASQVPYEDMRKPGDLTGESALAYALREFANPTPPQCSSELALREVIVECDLEVGHTQWHESRGCGVTWA